MAALFTGQQDAGSLWYWSSTSDFLLLHCPSIKSLQHHSHLWLFSIFIVMHSLIFVLALFWQKPKPARCKDCLMWMWGGDAKAWPGLWLTNVCTMHAFVSVSVYDDWLWYHPCMCVCVLTRLWLTKVSFVCLPGTNVGQTAKLWDAFILSVSTHAPCVLMTHSIKFAQHTWSDSERHYIHWLRVNSNLMRRKQLCPG